MKTRSCAIIGVASLFLAATFSGCGADVSVGLGDACVADTDCPDGFLCDPSGVCAAIEGGVSGEIACMTDDDCTGPDDSCDPESGFCYTDVPTEDIGAECTSDVDCLGDEVCDNGVCAVAAGGDDTSCGAEGDACSADSDCCDGSCGSDGTCGGTSSGGATGDPCTADSDCDSGTCDSDGTCD